MNRLHSSAKQVGIAWYNRLSEADRAYWHRVGGSARPVDAYNAYSRGDDRTQAKPAVCDDSELRRDGHSVKARPVDRHDFHLQALDDARNRLTRVSVLADWIRTRLIEANDDDLAICAALMLNDEIGAALAEQEEIENQMDKDRELQ